MEDVRLPTALLHGRALVLLFQRINACLVLRFHRAVLGQFPNCADKQSEAKSFVPNSHEPCNQIVVRLLHRRLVEELLRTRAYS